MKQEGNSNFNCIPRTAIVPISDDGGGGGGGEGGREGRGRGEEGSQFQFCPPDATSRGGGGVCQLEFW